MFLLLWQEDRLIKVTEKDSEEKFELIYAKEELRRCQNFKVKSWNDQLK